jgi:hypothetical protein
MSVSGMTFRPIPTADIVRPIVEPLYPPSGRSGPGRLPRILLQSAARGRQEARILLLSGVFGVLALLELAVYLRIPAPRPEVVYEDVPRKTLLGGRP